MAFHVIKSTSNTVVKALNVVDNVVDGTAVAAKIYNESMQSAYREQKIQSILEDRALLAEAKLTPEELILLEETCAS